MGPQDVERLLQDARSAVRGLRRNRGYTCAVVLILALGIGLNAAMYGLLSRLFLQAPPHIENPDGIHRVWVRQRALRRDSLARTGAFVAYDSMDWTEFSMLRDDTDRFTTVGGYTAPSPFHHGRGQSAAELQVSWVTGNLFALLGAQPVLGRSIVPEDDDLAAAPVAVVGHGYWERRFGGARQALGSTVRFNEVTYEIVGVMPPGFSEPEASAADVWLPLQLAGGAAALRRLQPARPAGLHRRRPGADDSGAGRRAPPGPPGGTGRPPPGLASGIAASGDTGRPRQTLQAE